MNDYFCVFRRDVNSSERRVVVERHGDVFSGLVKLGDDDLDVGDVQGTLARLNKKQRSMALWCTREDLPKDAPYRDVAATLDDTCSFARDEIFDSQAILEEMAQYGMTAWIDNTENKSYFELRASKDHLDDVEMACAKLFLGTLKMFVVFVQHAYYITISDVDSTEQSLEEEDFPDISSRGAGFQIKLYEPGLEFSQLALWQLLDEHALNMRNILRERARGEGKEEKAALVEDDLDDDEPSMRDMGHVDKDYLWGRCKEAYGGSYTQTYLMLRGEEGVPTRRALFRYGNWCYGGHIEMDQETTLHDVPLVLRKFQRQQGKLAYWFEVQSLPDGLPFSEPMKHFAMASAFLEEQLTGAEETLSKVNEYHKSKGVPAWIDEENGCQFFELETSQNQKNHYKEVELMASKTYFNGVVVITLYFQGSFYVTLSPSIDDQPLLDMSFPDVESKGRALQIATYKHPEFKKLLLWQSNRSVWETANRAVLEQRRQAALKRSAQERSNQEKAGVARAGKTTTAPEETATSPLEEAARSESKCAEGKVADPEAAKAAARSSAAADKAPMTRQPSALTRGTLEQKMAAPSVRAPHHLKPLGPVSGGGSKLPELDKGLVSDDAPWDAQGRPKALFGASSPLGDVCAGGGGGGSSSSSKK